MATDETRLPKSVAGLFGTAAALYVRRAGLYLALAVIAFGVQYLVGVLLPHLTSVPGLEGLVTGLGLIVDAYFVAAVSIGVAFNLAEKPADWSTVLLAASERWGVVSVVALINMLLFVALAPSVFGGPNETAYGLLVLPVVIFWGALALGGVVAAIEPPRGQLAAPFFALGKGMAVAFRFTNLTRLALLSLLAVLPNVGNIVLATVLKAHHIPDIAFWSNVPLDALTVGPLQVLATVFYVDFLRRARP